MKRLIYFIIILLLIITGCNKKEISLKSKIEYQEYIIDNTQMIAVVTNSSEEEIDIKMSVTYFDKNNVELGANNSILHAVSANEVVMDLGEVYKDYSTYRISISVVDSIYNDVSNIKINENDTGSLITIEAVNNNNSDVNLNIGALFYKDKEIIGYDYISGKANAVNVLNTAIYYPNNSVKNIDFDYYKLYINESYKN